MPNEEPPEPDIHDEADSISSAASEFGEDFVEILQKQYLDSIEQFSGENTDRGDHLRSMAEAVCNVFLGFIPTPKFDQAQQLRESFAALLAGSSSAPWSNAKNARRMALIDKRLDGSISSGEAFELAHLTTQMRAECDREESLPLEGVQRLLQSLKSQDQSD